MVEREPSRFGAAVDTAPAIAGEERTARDAPLHRLRDTDVVREPDHVGPHECRSGRAERGVEPLKHLGAPLPNEDVRTPHRAHVQWLEARVQHEDVMHHSRLYQRALWPLCSRPWLTVGVRGV